MKLVSVIVTFNRREKLQIAIEHMLDSDINAMVVVDNNSNDGTKEYLQAIMDERLHVLYLSENSGGAGGFHEGVKYVHESIKDYDWIVLSDDDAYVQPKIIDKFIRKTHPENISSYMSAVYYPFGGVCDMNVPGYHPFKDIKQIKKTLLKGNSSFHIDKKLYENNILELVDFASFVGLFFRKNVVDIIGYPDKEWFIYGDDLDYTLNMTKNNLSIYFDPNLHFIHDCETINTVKKVYSPMWKAYFTYRNGLIIYKKLSGRLFPFVVVLKTIKWYMSVIYYKDKKEYLKLVTIAIVDGIRRDRSKKIKDI